MSDPTFAQRVAEALAAVPHDTGCKVSVGPQFPHHCDCTREARIAAQLAEEQRERIAAQQEVARLKAQIAEHRCGLPSSIIDALKSETRKQEAIAWLLTHGVQVEAHAPPPQEPPVEEPCPTCGAPTERIKVGEYASALIQGDRLRWVYKPALWLIERGVSVAAAGEPTGPLFRYKGLIYNRSCMRGVDYGPTGTEHAIEDAVPESQFYEAEIVIWRRVDPPVVAGEGAPSKERP